MLVMCCVFKVSLENARELYIYVYCVGTENDSA